jgi:hypothetical protein
MQSIPAGITGARNCSVILTVKGTSRFSMKTCRLSLLPSTAILAGLNTRIDKIVRGLDMGSKIEIGLVRRSRTPARPLFLLLKFDGNLLSSQAMISHRTKLHF